MKKRWLLKSVTYVAVGLFFFLFSCNKDNDTITSGDSNNVNDEASTDGYFDDADDVATVAVWSDAATAGGREYTGGRLITTISDSRFACATVEIIPDANSSLDNPKGTITIDFGNGCTDARGISRKGKIVITYAGLRYAVGSTRSISFENYYVNNIKIEGVRTVTNIIGSTLEIPKFKVEVIGGKATWPDGTSATREVRIVREWRRNATNNLLDQWVVTQLDGSDFAASGSNRNGKTYQMKITKALVYKRECVSSKVFMAVEGTKELITDSRKITIDFGAGTCDRTVTITINGESRDIELMAGN